MKKLMKSVAIALTLSACATNVCAQKWLDKISKGIDKATETLEAVTGSEQQETPEAAQDTVSTKEFLEKVPEFTFVLANETDENGDTLRNDDGTAKYRVLIKDKKGNEFLSKDVTRKYINASLNAGANILIKVGVTATGGTAIGKELGGKKGALIGGAVGTALGGILAKDDIKETKNQLSALKKFKKELKQYQESFDNEGRPINKELSEKFLQEIEISEDNRLSMTTTQIEEELKKSTEKHANISDVDVDASIDDLL